MTDDAPGEGSTRATRRARGQSDLIGSLVIASFVLVAMSVVGVQLLSTFSVEEEPVADLDVSINATHVTVTHAGGDGLERDAVRVVVRNGSGAATRFTLDAATVEGDGDATFEVGERATHAHGVSGLAHVLVAHEPTGGALLDERVSVS